MIGNKKIDFYVLKDGKLIKLESIEQLPEILPDNFYSSGTDRIPLPKKVKNIER